MNPHSVGRAANPTPSPVAARQVKLRNLEPLRQQPAAPTMQQRPAGFPVGLSPAVDRVRLAKLSSAISPQDVKLLASVGLGDANSASVAGVNKQSDQTASGDQSEATTVSVVNTAPAYASNGERIVDSWKFQRT